jgi:aldehyde dehydrogenase (NAD+)
MPIAIAGQLEGGSPVIVLRYLAGLLAGASFEEERPGVIGGTTIVRREPIGVVGAIVPWNYPPTLASFKKLAFTGSTAAGRRIAETCGRLLRPVTLELGGKSAAIVLDDADLDLARIGSDLFAATLLNNGQTCYLGTRVLAPRSRYDEVVDTLGAFASSLAVGDALDPATQIGPMASLTHHDRVAGYIAKGSSDGTRLVTGGGRPQQLDRGWFVKPTVFAGDHRS